VFAIACATGKSRLILHTIRDIAADVNVIVFPTLSLIRDFVKESCDVLPLIADNHVMISSDEDYTVDCCTRKETKDALRTIQTLSTVSQISKWLLIHSSTAAEAPTAAAAKPKTQLLISTYASLNKVRTALSTSTKKNSVFVAFDEAHHVTEKNNVPVIFGNSDAEDDLPLAPKMAFFTATPVNRNGVEMTSSTTSGTGTL
jgi:superfamily II DNA or RNA helicase